MPSESWPGYQHLFCRPYPKLYTLPNWALASHETVAYGPDGAEFAFIKRYDGPSISTDFYILFGQVEIVMQAAPGIGIISSVVLMSDDADEIDFEFSGNDFGKASGTVQTNYFGKGIVGSYDRATQPAVTNPQSEFHIYTLDWSATTLTWSVDGSGSPHTSTSTRLTGAPRR